MMGAASQFFRSRLAGHSLTERLIDLIEELLLELFILDELTYACETLGYLVGWESAHEVED